MKKGIILTIVFLAVSMVNVHAANNVRLTVSCDQGEYTVSEPIKATFVLTNKGKKDVWVNKRFQVNHPKEGPKEHREISLAVTGPSGEKLEYKASYYEIGLPRSDSFVLLKRGEAAESERPKNIKGYFEFTELGKYKITATYRNVHGKEIGLDAFDKKIKSKPVVIRIVQKKEEE